MANGQTGRGFKPQFQQAGQTGMAGRQPVPNPNVAPPPGAVDINAKGRIPPGLMRFMNPGLMPGSVSPQGMRPGQPPPQMNEFAPGVPGGLPDPNAVGAVGLQQFPVGQPPLVPQGGIPMRQPVAMGGSFLGNPGAGAILASPGAIPAGQGQIPRNLLNLAMRRTGFMPQFGFFGP